MLETLIMFGIGILMVWVICKIFAWPLKILFKLVINAIMGAIVLLVINIIGSAVGFTLPITALTAAAGRAAWRAGRSAHSALGAFNVELQNCFPCYAGEAFCAWECKRWKIISKHCEIW